MTREKQSNLWVHKLFPQEGLSALSCPLAPCSIGIAKNLVLAWVPRFAFPQRLTRVQGGGEEERKKEGREEASGRGQALPLNIGKEQN